jgi:peptidoglycan/LPS O-acetylase OafA/YrhL
MAAFVVFSSHFLHAFAPRINNAQKTVSSEFGLAGTPLFTLVNGIAAVSLFFVLSGFVLSIGFYAATEKSIAWSVVKRWPRLVPVVLCSTIFSFICIKLNWFYHAQASALTGSNWLKQFGFSPNQDIFNTTFSEAFLQGSYLTFFRSSGPDAWLNTSLWTMNIELLGSFVVFGLTSIIRSSNKPRDASVVFLLAALTTYYLNPYITLFVFGAALAYLHNRRMIPESNKSSITLALKTFLIVAIFFFIFGYREPLQGVYSSLPILLEKPDVRILVHGLAAVTLIALALSDDIIKGFLISKPLLFLGQISFPLYVFHVPFICSFSSALFLSIVSIVNYHIAVIITFVCSLLILSVISKLASNLDRRWCALLE